MPSILRRLPHRIRPLPDEPFDSWFDATAYAYEVASGEMLLALGLSAVDGAPPISRWALDRLTTELTDAEAQALTTTTGFAADDFHRMTRVHHWAAGTRRDRTGSLSPASPTAGVSGRFCPECLQDSAGRWRLSWESPLGFSCPRHHRILVDRCPRCLKPPRSYGRPLTLIPAPGTCQNRRLGASGVKQRCDADLTSAEDVIAAADVVLAAQRIIFRTFSTGRATFGIYADAPQPAVNVLQDLRLIARLCRADARTQTLDFAQELDDALMVAFLSRASEADAMKSRPDEALNIAVGITLAVNTLHDRERVVNLLRGRLAESTSYSAHSPQIQELMAVSRGRRRRPTATLQSVGRFTDSSPADRARKLPTLLWSPWARRLGPRRQDKEIAAEALSAAVVFTGTSLTHSAALNILDPTAPSRRVTHVMRELGRGSMENATLLAIVRLAEYLDAADVPIDYSRRRTLDCTQLLPAEEWAHICRTVRVAVGTGRRHRIARLFLYRRLTGNPLRSAPDAWQAGAPIHASDLTDFETHAPERVKAALDELGSVFLVRNGISEPLVWEPPTIILDIVEEEVAAPSARGSDWPPARPAQDHVREVLPAAALLYSGGATTSELGAQAGVSRQTISRSLRSTGTTTRRGRNPVVIDPQWLRQKYIKERLTIPQIASLVGCTTTSVARRLRAAGIPIRPGGGSSEAAVLHPHPLAGNSRLLRRTLIGRHAIERARRFLVVASHPSVKAAADAMGLSATSLGTQLRGLSTDAGGELFFSWRPTTPMRLTPLGLRLVREFRAVLPPEVLEADGR